MSDIALAVHTHLQTVAAVTELVSDRGYPEALEENSALPAYTYTDVSADSVENLTGPSGLCTTRVQINCYSERKIEANELREQVRLALHGHHGAMGSEQVRSCSLAGKYGTYEDPIDGEASGRFVRSIDFLITHTEAIP